MSPDSKSSHRPRSSDCIKRSHEFERERIDRLSIEERIAGLLAEQGIRAIVIGAAALAAHRYVRHTEGIDLGVTLAIRDLKPVADRLEAAGFEVACREPDGQDPLGGVIDISGPFGLVQIVNFGERFPAIIESGLADASLRIRKGAILPIIPLPHLIGLKLYAGGTKSKADIVELLRRNPEDDRALCRKYRLRVTGLDFVCHAMAPAQYPLKFVMADSKPLQRSLRTYRLTAIKALPQQFWHATSTSGRFTARQNKGRYRITDV